uniref:U6 snRNA-associated Sm-like protein LSm8 n=1 Tax=Theileria annulata TaxID=5874 RepID=A0A3B0NB57_THEAN
MAPILEQFIECSVFVISVDGRVFVGVLKGFDQLTNLVLYNCLERVYHPDAPVEELELGIYLLRGDNMYRIYITLFIQIINFLNLVYWLEKSTLTLIEACLALKRCP